MVLLVAACLFTLIVSAQVSERFKEQLNAINAIKNDSIRFDSLYHFGRFVSDDDIPSAILIGKDLVREGELHNNDRAIANGNYLLGICYQFLPDFPQALKHYLVALRLQKQLNNVNFEIGTCLDIANVYEETGDLELQKQFILQAKKISDEHLNDPTLGRKRLMIFNNLGTISKKEGKYDSAIVFYNEVITGARRAGNLSLLIAGLGNQAIVYKTTKNFNAALKDYNDAIALIDTNATDFESQFQLAAILDNLGNLYYEKGDYKQAERSLLKSIELNKKVNVIDIYRDSYETLRKVYIAIKRYPEALDYYDRWVTVKDTILNKQKSQQIKELQTRYDTETKDKQITTQETQIAYNRKINFFLVLVSVLLLVIGALAFISQRRTAALNKEISHRKREVEQLNDVKDRIFSVISHDMKTPVNSLIAFTQILEGGNISTEKMTKYAAALKTTLGYTAGLMENLLNWARTQMQGYKPVMETFNISGTVQQAINLIKQDADSKQVSINTLIEGETLVFADTNMTALLLRNLLSNALKYTPNGGTISLSANTAEGKVNLSIEDTGVGMEASQVNAFNSAAYAQLLESKPGTNQEKGTGLGLMLCKNFASLMQGSIVLESEPGKGSKFIVTLLMP